MTNADGEWLKSAEEIATSAIHPLEEANLRFAMGKYCDDVNDFAQAFQNIKRGNELLKRQVTTASAWQVRQKIYKSSVARWHNYEKFIGPLKTLGK